MSDKELPNQLTDFDFENNPPFPSGMSENDIQERFGRLTGMIIKTVRDLANKDILETKFEDAVSRSAHIRALPARLTRDHRLPTLEVEETSRFTDRPAAWDFQRSQDDMDDHLLLYSPFIAWFEFDLSRGSPERKTVLSLIRRYRNESVMIKFLGKTSSGKIFAVAKRFKVFNLDPYKPLQV